MARCSRVGVRQPDMQREDAGFRTKPGAGQKKHEQLDIGGQGRGTGKQETAGAAVNDGKSGTDQQHAGLGEDEVEVRRLSCRLLLKVIEHQKKRRQGHHFPGQQESEHIARDHDQGHSHQQQIEKEHADRCFQRCSGVILIADIIDRRQRANKENRHQKKGGEAVDVAGQGENLQPG